MTVPEFAFKNRAPVVQPLTFVETTPEAMWLLQALSEVETLPGMLVLRPWVRESGPPSQSHPGIAVLEEKGLLLADGRVHPQAKAWLELLSAPTMEINGDIRIGDQHLRLVIARRGDLHVAMSRTDEWVLMEDLGEVRSMEMLVRRMLPLCGPTKSPAPLEPVTVPSADFMRGIAEVVRGHHSPAAALRGLDLSAEQRKIVVEAADKPEMELALTVVQHSSTDDHVAEAAVAVTDCVYGRVVTGPVVSPDGTWLTQICGGTTETITRSLQLLIKTLPVPHWQWQS
ncbi:ESX secretion-associated protein EspG [Mycobacteroides abscessus]|uniref:ESX secretion-associated protein EspG n=1 Tax=Mycobacteroides abscessus TaxID=36809 RepID=UPI0009A64022|nr:ESX secretion-associated protein EspG [Mycobacteroides abscessus]SKO15957.1 putative DNA-binding protein [Mycobacteroides abscessus subsp. bolletii]SKX37140.1 putative DNA-binding protein [Mycobacteroides abscessus subsp. bolletii]